MAAEGVGMRPSVMRYESAAERPPDGQPPSKSIRPTGATPLPLLMPVGNRGHSCWMTTEASNGFIHGVDANLFLKSCTVVVELFLRQGERFFSENFRCFFRCVFEADFSFLRP